MMEQPSGIALQKTSRCQVILYDEHNKNAVGLSIKGRSFDDKYESIQNHYSLSDNNKNKLDAVRGQDGGDKFISVKVDEINDYASHRAAFFINALAQLLLVNLSSLPLMGFIPAMWFKVLLVTINLLMVLTALWRLRTKKNRMLLGPSGLFSILYLVNAVTLLFAGQFIFTDQLPSLLQFIINIPLFILTIPLAIANGYWAFGANNEVVKAATERGKVIDKIKI